MKVLLSWSGGKSRSIASLFRNWLPQILPQIRPWISDEDIQKGSRWNDILRQELDTAPAGIVFVTRENMESPWLLFEAGALAKNPGQSLVLTYLIDISPEELFRNPLNQFQHTVAQRDDTKRLVRALNVASGVCSEQAQVDERFERLWSLLEEELRRPFPISSVAAASIQTRESEKSRKRKKVKGREREGFDPLNRSNEEKLMEAMRITPVTATIDIAEALKRSR